MKGKGSSILFFLLAGMVLCAQDPFFVIPACPEPPVIDGKISEGEWQFAAALTMLETVGTRNIRMEQPVFYVFRDKENLYLAMDSLASNTNTIVASCVVHDHLSIIGDDCLEIMLAPGSGPDIERFDFPVFYLAINALGTLWDCKFVPNSAESHNSWESGAEIANSVDGTHWVCEVRIPFSSMVPSPPADGAKWRMNLDRTYSDYYWSALNGSGGLNDARVGCDIVFDSRAPAVRVVNPHPLLDAQLQVKLEIANSAEKSQEVSLSLTAQGQATRGAETVSLGTEKQTVTVNPGQVVEVVLGKKQKLLSFNTVHLEALWEQKPIFSLQRRVNFPVDRFIPRVAKEVPLVYVFPRFLPSRERLSVIVDYTAWAKKTGFFGDGISAEISVWPKGKELEKPVMNGKLTEFKDCRGVWRQSTKNLPEGEYSVLVTLASKTGQLIAKHEDWFEKRIFDWMVNPRGKGEKVPAPYIPLKVSGRSVQVWGRTYSFQTSGLPESFLTQGKNYLKAPVTLLAQTAEGDVSWKTVSPFSFEEISPAAVSGRSVISGNKLKVELESITEYDGFVLFRMRYGPEKDTVTVRKMQVKIPLDARYTKFFSAAGDTQGVCIQGALLPEKEGKVYDSMKDTRSVCCSPTFATLFWVGDYDTCFCYAADSDKGWLIRDDAPAVEAYREGEQVIVYLNLVDKEYNLNQSRELEFAFQAGPTKPMIDNYRGIQDGGNPGDAPLTIIQVGGSGNCGGGGTHILHPGDTPEIRKQCRERLEKVIAGGNKAVVGYHYWGTVPKGRVETRVFRGEWGIDRYTWDANKAVREWEWQNKFYGDNRDLYIISYVKCVPSYVDFITYAYDEMLKYTPLSGFYDDTGYPKPVFDEELGLGFIREDGRKVYSSGLWIYRERWKRAAYVNFLHNRPNFLRDSQHCHAHFMPAYHFIGLWAPCEHGYYNPFKDRDNLGFYGSVDRFVAYNPGRQFGQPGMIGMSSPQWEAAAFVRDTRNMMMLAFLNDQDVGSFGSRDTRTVCRLRAARNIFRPWEKDTTFTGYWEAEKTVKRNNEKVLVSYYRKGNGLLFILGNTSFQEEKVTVEPDWKTLGFNHAGLNCFNPETGEAISLSAGNSKTGFSVKVPARDVLLVLAGKPGAYIPRNVDLTAPSLLPEKILNSLSDTFTGQQLSSSWLKDLHEGNASVSMIDGRLCVQGDHYGYAHIRKVINQDNISVQCLILRAPSGGQDTSGGSLFLVWPNGEFVQATPGVNEKKFLYTGSSIGLRRGSPISTESIFGWYPFMANWVKISLNPETIRFYSSSDGKEWKLDAEVKRGEKYAGPPEFVLLGNGHKGEKPHLDNVHPAHFNPQSRSPVTFFSDFFVGREE